MTNTVLKSKKPNRERPTISAFTEAEDFIAEMILYLKASDKNFSILRASKGLRRLSPSLISLITSKKRKLTYDRVDEISKLLRLDSTERAQLKHWVLKRGDLKSDYLSLIQGGNKNQEHRRREAPVHLLNDWLNVYVKDCFQFPLFQKQPELVYEHLELLAKPKRIKKSIQFLLSHGYLRKLIDGRIVVESNLTITESPLPSKKIRTFHKKAMKHAEKALELFSIHERFANTFLMPLSEERYQELLGIIKEFNEKTMSIADQEENADSRLYQLVLNLSPVGGKVK